MQPYPALRLSLLCLLLAGAGSASAAAFAAPSARVPASSGTKLQAIIASSDLAVGPNRFTFGLLDNNHPLSTGSPLVTFFALHGSTARPVERMHARFSDFARGLKDTAANSTAVENKGVYVVHPTFTYAGKWGMQVAVQLRGTLQVLRQAFLVRRHSLTPAVGSPAPRSNNPTVRQKPATLLDSGRPPDDMHTISIAAALARHRPLVVLFATAGFCTSRMCGPEIAVVEGLERRYRGRVSFVHIEIYQDANPANGYAPTVLQWHLQTEPWVFVVNRRGIITAKFEGPSPASDIEPAIRSALA